MLLLLPFSFLAGIVTILSPCILPILPIVLSGSVGEGKRRPFGVVTGFVASFTFFTLFLTSLVRATGLSADLFRSIAVVVVFGFGVSLLIPKVQFLFERLFSHLAGLIPHQSGRTGFFGGLLIGMSLGLVWTPCVGPILASIISLALTGAVTGGAVLITLSYAAGTAVPMLVIMMTGRKLFERAPWLVSRSGLIQRGFGVVMIVVAIAILTNVDRKFQGWVLTVFPNYGANLTKFEDVPIVRDALKRLDSSAPITNNPASPAGGQSLITDGLMPVLRSLGPAPELILGGQWFNSEPLALTSLRGRVVLIDFWTYTCINCIRTLPYLKSWDEKYRDKGLTIIGVHTPEFEFEKNPKNVEKAIADFGIEYPVMQDNDYATWNAYRNRYWPAKYLVDKDGQIRYTHFGEGGYDESERAIQMLLKEAGTAADMPIENPSYTIAARTPELYLGYRRMDALAPSQFVTKDKSTVYDLPSIVPLHGFAFGGKWEIAPERARGVTGSTLILRFEAKEVFLVMRPRSFEPHVEVRLDGESLSNIVAGEDVTNAVVTVNEDRLYRLINLDESGEHVLELKLLDGNVELYAFTFG